MNDAPLTDGKRNAIIILSMEVFGKVLIPLRHKSRVPLFAVEAPFAAPLSKAVAVDELAQRAESACVAERVFEAARFFLMAFALFARRGFFAFPAFPAGGHNEFRKS